MYSVDGGMADMVQECWIGTDLARRLGLKSNFFAQAHRDERITLKSGVTTKKMAGLVMVRLGSSDTKIIRDESYVAVKIESDDTYEYDHVLKLTNKTSIGFYR